MAKRNPKSDRHAKAIAAIRAKFGADSALVISEDRKAEGQVTEVVSTRLDVVDNYLLGVGGTAIGRITELFGDEGTGKTSLAYQIGGSYQQAGGLVVWADGEFSFDEDRARVFGMDPDQTLMLNAQHLEQWFEMAMITLRNHDPDDGPILLVLDTLASMRPASALKGEPKPGEHAAIVSAKLPLLSGLVQKKRAHLLVLNQVRVNFGVMFGNNTTTPGGKSLKFYASSRLQFFGGKSIKNKHGEHTGKIVTLMTIKSRFCSPFRKVRLRLDYDLGYNNLWSTLEHAKTKQLIKPREAGFSGAARGGLEAYQQALELLEWEPSVPLEELAAREAGEGADDEIEEEEEEDDDEGDED